MNRTRAYRKILIWGGVICTAIALTYAVAYYFLRHMEEELIQEQMEICQDRAGLIKNEVEADSTIRSMLLPLLQGGSINLESSRVIEEALTGIIEGNVTDVDGLEGGFYIRGLDDFKGYAYPTSEPPVPAYGPPPRSYNIIRDQALASIRENRPIVDLHKFDPAVFPLATHPFHMGDEVAGAVWVRIHIERDLPVARLRQVLYIVTVIFGIGFMVMAIFTLFLRNEVRSIQRELASTRSNPGYRLKPRYGFFGFVPRRINEMLDLIEKEYQKRLELEKQLHHKVKLASLGKMIAGVAHEVRTPLSVIKTRLQMWEMNSRKQSEPGIEPEAMSMVVNEINRVADLMKRLQVFSRPIHDHLKQTRVDEVLEEVLGMMDPGKYGDGVRVRKEFCEDLPVIISDANSLKQVFINVLTNAAESLSGSGEILVETDCDVSRGVLIVRISDTGSGMDQEIMKHVFDPFYSTKETGSGLGLTISSEIIMSLGGEIRFQRNEPMGTICFISLPVTNHIDQILGEFEKNHTRH